MSNSANNDAEMSNGIDALIERLRLDGVTAGKSEAEEIVQEAKEHAKSIVSKAKSEAQKYIENSRKESAAFQASAEGSLKTAMRDSILEMKSNLMQRFISEMNRLTSTELKSPDVIKQMILEVTRQTSEEAGINAKDTLEVILPSEAKGLDELRQNPEELGQGELTEFVRGITGDMLREGVILKSEDNFSSGIKVHVKEKNLILDLSDEAIAGILLQHLQPRFRAILEGIIK
jgi:V/A-type H+/Na+-transporting ATPase subunit E